MHNVSEPAKRVRALLTRRTVLAQLGLGLPWMAQAQAQAPTSRPRIAFVSHAPDSDSWWNIIRNALAHAKEDFGLEVDYLNPADGNIAAMARLLDGLKPERYAGVISTIADLRVLAEPLRGVVQRKLPLITVNSGTEAQSEQLGALMHIGQPEFLAGREAGAYFAKKDVRSLVCFNHYPSNPASNERCEGFRAGLGGKVRMEIVKMTGSAAENQAIAAEVFRQSEAFDVALALGPGSAHPVLAAAQATTGKAPVLVTFDLSSEIVAGIRSGRVAFAIDQQPYLQGYLSMGMLAESLRRPADISRRLLKGILYAEPKLNERMARYGLSLKTSDGRHIHSGPSFVSRINVDKVERFSGQFR